MARRVYRPRVANLADVAITALCAMQHFTQDQAVTRAYLASKVHGIITRSGITKAGVH